MKLFAIFLTATALFALNAADLTTKTGKVYKSYSVVGTTAEGITILHSSGGITVPLEDWPDDKKDDVSKYIDRVEKRRKAIASRPDLKTKSGMVYKKYKILGFTQTEAKVSHWGGNSLVKISDLPENIKKEHTDALEEIQKNNQLLHETPKIDDAKVPELKFDKPAKKGVAKSLREKDDDDDKPDTKASDKNEDSDKPEKAPDVASNTGKKATAKKTSPKTSKTQTKKK